MFNRIKSIRHYFPDIVIAQDLLKRGVEKYTNHRKYTLVNGGDALCNGKLFFSGHPLEYRDVHEGKLYVSPGLAAVMFATRKEPHWFDLNTPYLTYGWTFNDTRDIIGALDALYEGNPWYWNLFYGHENPVSIIHKQKDNTWKRIINYIFISIALACFCSCKKETPIPEAHKQQAASFKSFLLANNYRLVSYKSDTPIDYDPTDTVPAKTNHWEYVSFHLKDDKITFNTNQVNINQGNNLMTGTTGDIVRTYSVAPDQEGVAFHYLNFTYDPLTYRLIQFNDSAFVVKALWNGNEVTSTFKIRP